MDASVIKEYLVRLGFDQDTTAQNKFNEALRVATEVVGAATGQWGRMFVEAGAATVAALTGIATGAAAMSIEVARGDLQMQLLARRAYMSTPAFREMSLALKALGVSAEDILIGPPELREHYLKMTQNIRGVMGGAGMADFEQEMVNIRKLDYAFKDLQLSAQLFVLSLTKSLSKALTGDEGGLLRWMTDLNEKFMKDIPYWSDLVARYLAPVMRDVWGIVKDLGSILSDVISPVLMTIGLVFNDPKLLSGKVNIENIGSALKDVADFMKIIADLTAGIVRMIMGIFHLPGKALDALARSLGIQVPEDTAAAASAGTSTYAGSGTSTPLNANDMKAIAQSAAAKYGVDPALMLSVLQQESNFGQDPRIWKPGAAGELGMFQLTPGIVRRYGVTDPLDPRQSAEGAAHYLSDLSRQYRGNEYQMARAYNGSGPMAEAYAQQVMGRTNTFNITINTPTTDPAAHAQIVKNIIDEHDRKKVQRQILQSNPVYATGG